MHVVGWDRAEYAISACKAAPAAAAVDAINVTVSRGVVTASGPSGGRWVVYLIVKAPMRADLALKTTNGPISVAGVSGSVQAHTTNGPIGLKDSGGRIDARAQNGPVSFAGRGGEVSLTAVNGPINVQLDGDRWQDGSLSARAENGPVHVRVAENYLSGVRVESSGHSPWSCKGEACRAGRKDWDDGAARLSSARAQRWSAFQPPMDRSRSRRRRTSERWSERRAQREVNACA